MRQSLLSVAGVSRLLKGRRDGTPSPEKPDTQGYCRSYLKIEYRHETIPIINSGNIAALSKKTELEIMKGLSLSHTARGLVLALLAL